MSRVRKRLTKAEALKKAHEQLNLFKAVRDPESYYARLAAEDAIRFLQESERKVFTVKEVETLLDW